VVCVPLVIAADWLVSSSVDGRVLSNSCGTWVVTAAVVDILDIKWQSLVSADKPKPVQPGSTLRRFTAHRILRDIGVSAAFAGDALFQRLKSDCQQQMEEEAARLAAEAG